MSDKVRIGGVLNEAVMFGAHHWLTYVRFAWAPFVLIALLSIGLTALLIDFGAIAAAGEATGQLQAFSFDTLFRLPVPVTIVAFAALGLVIAFLMAGPVASIARLVILGEKNPGLVHVRMDGPARRVFIAMVISGLINIVIWAVAVAIVQFFFDQNPFSGFGTLIELMKTSGVAGANGTAPSLSPEQLDEFKNVMAAWGGVFFLTIIPSIYVGLKLVPFVPGSAAENRLILMKSLRMTRGHFWSIFGAYVLFVVFLGIAGIVLGLSLEIINVLLGFLANQGTALAVVGIILVVIVNLIEFVFNLFSATAQLALSAIIYRRIETGE